MPVTVSLFFEAVKINNIELVQSLLDKDEVLIHEEDEAGFTALHIAVFNGHRALVKLLLDKSAGFNINVKAQNGLTALHIAAERGYVEIVVLLLNAGADINTAHHAGLTALGIAALNRRRAVVELLLENGANITMQDNEGWTALHIAAERGYGEIVALLLNAEAEVDIDAQENTLGRTALHLATLNRDSEMVNFLLDRRADVNVKDRFGLTALYFVSAQGCVGMVTTLLNHNADINVQDNRGWTALHVAAKSRHSEVMKLLLGKGIDINIQDSDTDTALHHAGKCGYIEGIKLLLDVGADINAKNTYGDTVLHFAVEKGHVEVIKWLLQHDGIDITKRNDDGQTALDVACIYNQPKAAQILFAYRDQIDPNNTTNFAKYLLRCPLFAIYVLSQHTGQFKSLSAQNRIGILNYAIEQYAYSESISDDVSVSDDELMSDDESINGVDLVKKFQLKQQLFYLCDRSSEALILWTKIAEVFFPEKLKEGEQLGFYSFTQPEMIVVDYIIKLRIKTGLKAFEQMYTTRFYNQHQYFPKRLPNELVNIIESKMYSTEDLFKGCLFEIFYEKDDVEKACELLTQSVGQWSNKKEEELKIIFSIIKVNTIVQDPETRPGSASLRP